MNVDELSEHFKNYQKMVYRTAFLILGTREEAEDALQDIFLKIYQSYDRYDPAKAALSTWIYRVTVNHCLKRKTRFLWRFLPLFQSQETLPIRSTTEWEEDQLLGEALAHLTSEQRALVALRYGWQLPYEEIAQIMGIPLGTVKSRHTRVIKILQAYYSQNELPALVEKEIK
jgi:RNA polymerase sigma-70 factor, ECF subfamily